MVEVVSRCPDDGRDPGVRQVQLGQLRGPVGHRDVVGRRCFDAGALDEGVDHATEALVEEAVGVVEGGLQVAGEGQGLDVGGGQAAGYVIPSAAYRRRFVSWPPARPASAGMALNRRRPSGSCSAVGSATP